MTDQEINHLIATQVNGWIHDEGIFYHDASGFTCYLADYCNSIPHAMDLAKANGVALKPTVDGWSAYKLADETVVGTDSLASKAICLCLTATLSAS
ncbi:MAG: hypothetical protein KME09_20545 [Pleurocapsa minor HA4230-MV1]|jgi:hypothetical protein|nr:hypothetical protein [Pleurocapsa minor HA4230-MV1]